MWWGSSRSLGLECAQPVRQRRCVFGDGSGEEEETSTATVASLCVIFLWLRVACSSESL